MADSLPPGGTQRAAALQARSISRPVWEWLSEGSCNGQVLAVFERTCLLEMAEGNLAALVLPQIGNGPLNVVVEGQPGCFSTIQPRTPASVEGDRLRVGALEVSIHDPVVWDPRPAWDALRTRRGAIAGQMPLLQLFALRHAASGSLLQVVSNRVPGGTRSAGAPQGELPDAVVNTAREGASSLVKGWAGDPTSLQSGAARLAGLGVGLTPAGDDLLCGLMLWAWLAHPSPLCLCQLIQEAASARTTALSAAFLRASAQGECSAPWHGLLTALGGGREVQVEVGIQEVLAYGSTSGADTLAGFLLIATDAKGLGKPLGSGC